MKVRLEAQQPQLAPQDVAVSALGRLIAAGLLPTSTKARDPLSAAVQHAFAQAYPDRPTPSDLEALVETFVEDAEGDGSLEVDVTALQRLGVIAADRALPALSNRTLEDDAFEAMAPGSAVRAPVALRWEALGISSAGHPVTLTYGAQSSLQLRRPLKLDGAGKVVPAADGEAGTFHTARLFVRGSTLALTLDGETPATFLVTAAGALWHSKRLGERTALSLTAGEAGWLFEELLETVQATGSQEAWAPFVETMRANRGLRERTSAPEDRAERTVWNAQRASNADADRKVKGLEETWGVRPLRWAGWVDDVREIEVARAVLDACEGQDLIHPAFLYAIAIGEGLNAYLDEQSTPLAVNVSARVSGFGQLGVDTFGSEVARLKARRLLPADFNEGPHYVVSEELNERSERVTSAEFSDLKTGLVALRAMLADMQLRFLDDVESTLGPAAKEKLTRDHVDYFTYLYFNAGPGFGRRQVRERGLNDVAKWRAPYPTHNGIARFNALQRLSTVRLLESLGLFE